MEIAIDSQNMHHKYIDIGSMFYNFSKRWKNHYLFGHAPDRYAIYNCKRQLFFRVNGVDTPIHFYDAWKVCREISLTWRWHPFHQSDWLYTKRESATKGMCIEDSMVTAMEYCKLVEKWDELRELEKVYFKEDLDTNFVPSLGTQDEDSEHLDFWEMVEDFNIPDPFIHYQFDGDYTRNNARASWF